MNCDSERSFRAESFDIEAIDSFINHRNELYHISPEILYDSWDIQSTPSNCFDEVVQSVENAFPLQDLFDQCLLSPHHEIIEGKSTSSDAFLLSLLSVVGILVLLLQDNDYFPLTLAIYLLSCCCYVTTLLVAETQPTNVLGGYLGCISISVLFGILSDYTMIPRLVTLPLAIAFAFLFMKATKVKYSLGNSQASLFLCTLLILLLSLGISCLIGVVGCDAIDLLGYRSVLISLVISFILLVMGTLVNTLSY